MSDPAIEAAERASLLSGGGNVFIMADGITAAREALKPIRDWLLRNKADLSHPLLDVVIEELLPLIYSTEELAR